eukprot:13639806-Alexandrium_andersonii.AAC.1
MSSSSERVAFQGAALDADGTPIRFPGVYVGGVPDEDLFPVPDPTLVCLPGRYEELDGQTALELLLERFPELKHFRASERGNFYKRGPAALQLLADLACQNDECRRV